MESEIGLRKSSMPSVLETNELDLDVEDSVQPGLRVESISSRRRSLELESDSSASGRDSLSSSPKLKSVRFEESRAVGGIKLRARSSPLITAVGASRKSIIKKSPRTSVEIELLQFKDVLTKHLTKILAEGAVLKKCYGGLRAEKRFFRVTPDGSELRYRKPSGRTEKVLELASVSDIIFGPRTRRFEDYDCIGGKPYNCFSIVYPRGTLDIECSSREELMNWLQGLQLLCPLSHYFLSRAQINFQRAGIKVRIASSTSQTPVDELIFNALTNFRRSK
jgi:hypothetical protein